MGGLRSEGWEMMPRAPLRGDVSGTDFLLLTRSLLPPLFPVCLFSLFLRMQKLLGVRWGGVLHCRGVGVVFGGCLSGSLYDIHSLFCIPICVAERRGLIAWSALKRREGVSLVCMDDK